MKSYFLLFSILFLSFNSFGQDWKIIKVEATTDDANFENPSVKMNFSYLHYDDLLKPGKYKVNLMFQDCSVVLSESQSKNDQLPEEFITQIKIDLAKFQVKTYLNGELQSDCKKINNKKFPIFILISEK